MRVFTVEYRDQVEARILEIAKSDPRITAGAMVGGLTEGGDRWSDLDLTFGLAEGASLDQLLPDWTHRLEQEFDALHLFDLPHRTTLYRVFLFPGNLQVDLSFTAGHEFGALTPRFKLLFGTTVEREHNPPPNPGYLRGLAAHHAVRARFCIERGRPWQAEYWIHGLRDEALSLAALKRGLNAREGRGFDALPGPVRDRAQTSLVRNLEKAELLRALDAGIALLIEEGEVDDKLARRLRELTTDPTTGG